jgi:hypothetical protein
LGAALFKLVFVYLVFLGNVRGNNYRLNSVPIGDIPAHTLKVGQIAFKQLWDFDVSFFPASLIHLFAIVFVFAIIVIILNLLFSEERKMSPSNKIAKATLIVLFVFLFIVSSKSTALISPTSGSLTSPHILFFGDIFLRVFPIALIFIQGFKLPKAIIALVAIVLINMCLIQDALALKAWKFGFEAEKMMWNRVYSRIESLPDFDNKKNYSFFHIGEFPSYREKFYGAQHKNVPLNLLRRGYADVNPPDAFSFFFPDLSLASRYRRSFIGYLKSGDKKAVEASNVMKEEINNAQNWPADGSIIIKDDIMIIVFNQQELKQVQDFIASKI